MNFECHTLYYRQAARAQWKNVSRIYLLINVKSRLNMHVALHSEESDNRLRNDGFFLIIKLALLNHFKYMNESNLPSLLLRGDLLTEILRPKSQIICSSMDQFASTLRPTLSIDSDG